MWMRAAAWGQCHKFFLAQQIGRSEERSGELCVERGSVPKGRQGLAVGFSRRTAASMTPSPEGTAERRLQGWLPSSLRDFPFSPLGPWAEAHG